MKKIPVAAVWITATQCQSHAAVVNIIMSMNTITTMMLAAAVMNIIMNITIMSMNIIMTTTPAAAVSTTIMNITIMITAPAAAVNIIMSTLIMSIATMYPAIRMTATASCAIHMQNTVMSADAA